MKKTILFTAMLLVASAASATYCKDGSRIESHPNGNCNVPIPGTGTNSNPYSEASSNQTQGQVMGQAQGQGQVQGITASGNSANENTSSSNSNSTGGSNTGGNSNNRNSSSSSAADNGSGNSVVGGSTGGNTLVGGSNQAGGASGNAVTVAGDSVRSNAVAWAPVIPGAPASPLAAANLAIVPGVCGPRVEVERRVIVGKRFGPFGGQYDVEQGYEDVVTPSPNRFVEADGYLWGHKVTRFATVLGTSSAQSFSVGGYGTNSNGGQGGASASGQLQQIVKQADVEECVYATRPVIVPMASAVVACPLSLPTSKPIARKRKPVALPVCK